MTQRRAGEKAPIEGLKARPPAFLHSLLFDRYADAVLVTDESGRIVEANLAATTLLGHSRAELLALGVSDISRSERGEADLTRWGMEGYWRDEIELLRKDGIERPGRGPRHDARGPRGTLGCGDPSRER